MVQPSGYVPKVGDKIFVRDTKEDLIGEVCTVTKMSAKLLRAKVVEGNARDGKYRTVKIDGNQYGPFLIGDNGEYITIGIFPLFQWFDTLLYWQIRNCGGQLNLHDIYKIANVSTYEQHAKAAITIIGLSE